MAERASRKKNDREVTVTRCSRLLSRHSARLSCERSVIARDRSQIGISHSLGRLSRRRCYHRDRWTEVHATRRDTLHPVSLLLLSFSLALPLSLSLVIDPHKYLNQEITRSRSIIKLHCNNQINNDIYIASITYILYVYLLCCANFKNVLLRR